MIDSLSPGAWALAPFRLADSAKLANQAAMVSLGRPGAGEALLTGCGFVDVERIDVRLAFSTVNDALGVLIDGAFRDTTPPAVLDAITFGRPFEDERRSDG